jgi:hypothetical protein
MAEVSTLSPEELNEMANEGNTWYEQYGHDFFKPVKMPEVIQTPLAIEQPQTNERVPGEGFNPVINRPACSKPTPTGKFKCSICGKSFARRQRLEACENDHKKMKPYACQSLCGEPNWYVPYLRCCRLF